MQRVQLGCASCDAHLSQWGGIACPLAPVLCLVLAVDILLQEVGRLKEYILRSAESIHAARPDFGCHLALPLA
jgi:hypothetical protein